MPADRERVRLFPAESHFDVLVVGTDLPQSILSAALARAGAGVRSQGGFKALHIDENEYYGGRWAGLSLKETVAWAKGKGKEVELAFPRFGDGTAEQVPEVLARLDRHYSLPLTPTLVPSTGAAIDALVRSNVAAHATFRLLEETVVAGATLRHVPSSKEDIFKDRTLTLVEKRKLMKFLQSVMEHGQEHADADLSAPFDEYLRSKFGFTDSLVTALAYGIALLPHTPDAPGPSRIDARAAIARCVRHLRSVGRYGNAAYLVGQYGGAGELAQAYCRASAVHGTAYMLGTRVERMQHSTQESQQKGGEGSIQPRRWSIQLDSLEGEITADLIIGGHSEAPAMGSAVARATIVLDRPLHFPAVSPGGSFSAEPVESRRVVDTALLVFPPGSVEGGSSTQAVHVLMLGEGTFSCPKGQYVYCIEMQGPESNAQTALSPYVAQVLRLAQPSPAEWQDDSAPAPDVLNPLFSLYHTQLPSAAGSSHPYDASVFSVPFPPPAETTSQQAAPPSLPDYCDRATSQAEDLFWRVVEALPALNPGEASIQTLKSRAAEKDRRRRKRRAPEEFQGRAGAFPQDAEQEGTDGNYGGQIDGVDWDDIVEFFEPQEQSKE